MDFSLDYITSSNSLVRLFKIDNVQKLDEDIFKQGIIFAICVVGILTPVMEEFLNRYCLTSFTWNNTILPLNAGFIIVQLFNIESSAGLAIIIALSLSASIIIYNKIKKSPAFKTRLSRFYIKNYSLYFYTAAITFGVAHIGNFQIGHFIPVLPVVLVLPQIFAGLILGYIRIVMGIRWSIAFHCLHNLFIVTILFATHNLQ
ncbi:MAG: CPBP family glutamic-type intramembrane protease [Ferruginibacter sp.]